MNQISQTGWLSPFLLHFSHFAPLLFSIKAALTPFTPQPYELLAALMYGQYSFYHINTATVCQDSGGRWAEEKEKRKQREGGRERGREGRHICSTHLSAKRYNYLSQHIIHVLYQPRALCLCLATLTTCKGHILTLAMTVYLRKENCPLGYGER